ncbi:hypothetical protein Q9295_10240 [Xinfangfangia sp. CPCC 101601]|uniref:Uncharacterized protein n=1 Tax=Pseudogemmobacter lacusdianii TaxID=3069608 RepID=A0ABU0VYC9_9RHOB|nr:hypothetical protein [Xinfangfangia sp. CPCC 101601]MDQ2066757.1 hypothetical protein [Xinfangfangia sp. CPCC 101601]
MSESRQPFDEVGFIMEVESEGFDAQNDKHIAGVQEMIRTKLIWQLQGSWQRLATALINAGLVKP